jgi:hypothetical protein
MGRAKFARLNVRLEPKLLSQVKWIAQKQHTTVTALIEACLLSLIEADKESRRPVDAEQV